MKTVQSITLAACTLVAAANSQVVVNVDVGNTQGTYSGQGALATSGDLWNGIGNSGTDLLASNGADTTISVNLVSGGLFGYANQNALLADYQFISKFGSPSIGGITISGLEEDSIYTIYVYSAGDSPPRKASSL